MGTKEHVKEILKQIVHPETGQNLVDGNMVESIAISDDRIAVTLVFSRSRDPFMNSIKRQTILSLEEAFPDMKDKVQVLIKEGTPRPAQPEPQKTTTEGIKNIIAIASGKGGVGKSTVTANLAVTLSQMGYRVGVLDADIYGPSQPKMFGVEGFMPSAVKRGELELIVPAEAYGISLMSIGFFIAPGDALVWRGPMATNALKQMIHQTDWGALDFLLIDLPPGTGDVHLTILQELKISGAVIVSTPQQVAVADVRRGIGMFKAPKIEIPVLGLIENMAWFTPAELPNNRYYIFGKGGGAALAQSEEIPFLGEIPIVQSVMEGSEAGNPGVYTHPAIAERYRSIADQIVKNLK